MYCYPVVDVADELKLSNCSSNQSSLVLDSVAESNISDALQSAAATTTDEPWESDDDSIAMESFDDVEDFCIIDEPGLGIMVSQCEIFSALAERF